MDSKSLVGISLTVLLGCGGDLASSGDTHSSVYDWGCLSAPSTSPPATTGRVTYVVPVVDFDSQLYAPTTVLGAELTVCTSASCDPPFADWQGGPGAGGLPFVWGLSFPVGLSNVTLRFSAPGYVPMDYAVGGPMVEDSKGVGIPLVRTPTLDELEAQVGLSVDPARGTYAARALNCNGQRASGVVIGGVPMVSDAVPFSLSNDNLATRATLQTDERGVAGFFNLTPGTLDVSGVLGSAARVAEPSTVNIRPGVITLTEVRPTLGIFGQ